MNTFLRQPHSPYRISQAVISSSRRTSHQVFRNSNHCEQSVACQSIRRYATSNTEGPEKSKKKTDGAEANARSESASPVARQDAEPGKPTRGFEQLYTNKALSTPPEKQNEPTTEEPPLRPGFTRLTEVEQRALDETFDKIRASIPQTLVKEVEAAFQDMKKYGVPDDLMDIVRDLQKGTSLSLSMAARLIRITSQMARMRIELDAEEKQGRTSQQQSSSSSQQQQQDKKKEKQKSQDKFNFDMKMDTSTFLVSSFTAYLLYRMIVPSDNLREITWQEFQASFLNKGFVDKLTVINGNKVKVHVHRETISRMHPDSPAANNNFYYYFTIGSVEAFERKLDEAQKELGIPSSERIPVSYTHEVSWAGTLASFGPSILLTGLMLWGLRRAAGGSSGSGPGGIFGMGRSRAKRFNHETDIKIRFKDVAGMDEAKTEIMEFVSFLKEPGRFQRLGAKIPRGAILSGPPGTGKTLLAKATAGESQVPFFSVSGSEFVEMFVGVGPSRVRDLFANARKSTPCIIFIDEIDAIGKSRAKQSFGSGNDERESTLNQILTEMDGFNTSEQVVVLAGTNRPDVLDAALMRPGRFDRHIAIDRPTMEGRKQIFGVHLRNIITSEDKSHLQGRLAALTPGFSGADIANCCNEAALIAARESADKVVIKHFEQAIERTVAGLEKKTLVLSPEERKTVAYHEAGHAICGWFFRYADPLLKVSIIPRGQGALGYALNVPADTYLMNVNQLMDRMAMILGGRVSEEIHFESVTSGASDDFNKVTRMATSMVTKFGMSKKVGYIFYEDDNQSLHKPFSEETARNIDVEVRRIVDEAYKQCKDLLTEKKKEVGLVAEELLKKEMLDRDDMVRLLGKRPFPENKEFEKYFGGKSAPPPPPTETPSPDVPPDAAPAIFKRL